MTISIPSPCHEKWQNLTPTINGGFCSSCRKEVIDFTTWTDAELSDFFKEHPMGICGRFKQSQLATNLENTSARHLSLKWASAYLIAAALLCVPRESNGQSKKELTEQIANESDLSALPKIVGPPLSTTITGVVWKNPKVRANRATVILKAQT